MLNLNEDDAGPDIIQQKSYLHENRFAIDANFRLKGKNRDTTDVPIFSGTAYLVNDEQFKHFIDHTEDRQEVRSRSLTFLHVQRPDELTYIIIASEEHL